MFVHYSVFGKLGPWLGACPSLDYLSEEITSYLGHHWLGFYVSSQLPQILPAVASIKVPVQIHL